MIKRFYLSPLLYWLVFASLLSACEQAQKSDTELLIQQNLFLQSISLVEHAGSLLQNPGLSQSDIDKAMLEMDEGLGLAFQVTEPFLSQLDERLPKFYTRVFIPGVEQYRLGVEASDKQQQINGLNRLSQWGQYWLQLKPEVHERMRAVNG